MIWNWVGRVLGLVKKLYKNYREKKKCANTSFLDAFDFMTTANIYDHHQPAIHGEVETFARAFHQETLH
jgi:hypothetical protein